MVSESKHGFVRSSDPVGRMESGQLDKGKRMRGGDVSGSWINDQGTVKGNKRRI